MTQLKNKIIASTLAYTMATYATQLIGIFTSFAMRYFLEPSLMGAWSVLDLILSYGLYANLGVQTAMIAELPFFEGAGNTEKAAELRKTCFSFGLFSSTVVAAFFCVWLFKTGNSVVQAHRFEFFLLPLILISTSLYNFYQALMYAEKRFTLLGKSMVFNAVVYLTLICTLCSVWKLTGLVLAVLISTCLSSLFLHYFSRPKLGFLLDKNRIIELLKISLPLLSIGFAYTFFMSIDRMMITKFLNVEALGHYSIALLVITYASAIPKLLAAVIFPDLQEKFGKTASRTAISGYITKPTLALAYTAPILLGFAYFTAPFLIRLLLPKYIPGIQSLEIFLIGVYFLCLSQAIQNYLTTIHKRLHHIPIILTGAAVAALTSYWGIKVGHGIEGVAIGMSAGFFVYYTVLLVFAFSHFYTASQIIRFYLETLFCFASFYVTLMAIPLFIKAENVWLQCVLQNFVFGLVGLSWLFLLNKKTGLLHAVGLAAKEYVVRKKVRA